MLAGYGSGAPVDALRSVWTVRRVPPVPVPQRGLVGKWEHRESHAGCLTITSWPSVGERGQPPASPEAKPMADSNAQLPWTDDQWNRVRRVIYEEARAARVAGNFLPLYGPLAPDAAYVSQELLIEPNGSGPDDTVPGFTVDDTTTLKLSTLQVKVFLRSAQVDDPGLTSALIAFRRARTCSRISRTRSFSKVSKVRTEGRRACRNETSAPALWEVRGGQETRGLLDPHVARPRTAATSTVLRTLGERLVSDVSRAVGELESRYHLGPFACVLGHRYFQAVQTPDNSLELPQDRILPFLGGGPLVRSSAVPDRHWAC